MPSTGTSKKKCIWWKSVIPSNKEGKSQRVIYERGGCSRFAIPKHIKCCLKSCVKFPQSVMVWGAMSSAGVGPLCFLKYTVNAAIYQDILEHFMLPSADKLYGDADFIFQQDLAPTHTAKGTKSWLNDHGVTVLDWPANSTDLNPIDNLWGIVKRKMRDTRPNNADDLKAAIRATWALITPEQCHRLIDSMPRRIDAKGGPTNYWVHRNEHAF